MKERRRAHVLSLIFALASVLACAGQRTTRSDSSDPAHPFNTPAAVSAPASDQQLALWREQAMAALFLPKTMPVVAARNFGSFVPMPGVVAHRVTYGTQYGGRVTAVVYGPKHAHGKLPAVVVVAGHGGSKSTWYEVYAGSALCQRGSDGLTYDPVGEEERNSLHLSDGRAHDTVLPGLESPARLGRGHDRRCDERGELCHEFARG